MLRNPAVRTPVAEFLHVFVLLRSSQPAVKTHRE